MHPFEERAKVVRSHPSAPKFASVVVWELPCASNAVMWIRFPPEAPRQGSRVSERQKLEMPSTSEPWDSFIPIDRASERLCLLSKSCLGRYQGWEPKYR